MKEKKAIKSQKLGQKGTSLIDGCRLEEIKFSFLFSCIFHGYHA